MDNNSKPYTKDEVNLHKSNIFVFAFKGRLERKPSRIYFLPNIENCSPKMKYLAKLYKKNYVIFRKAS